ncbi:hypothetical protein QAD02_022660 [Eretmocerus hayati]|uniref:Uncharacterized protein n=1 Tax=Eretmocerus hayati TaxID=131215 RepID=A0ACC2PV96_9HYME|nr:hypothetical protein QAD02_022660 [Eretmocerus hayati]
MVISYHNLYLNEGTLSTAVLHDVFKKKRSSIKKKKRKLDKTNSPNRSWNQSGTASESSSPKNRLQNTTIKEEGDAVTHKTRDLSSIDWKKLDGKLFIVCPNEGCDRSYIYEKAFNKHIQHECGKIPRFKCGHCGHLYHNASNIYRHSFKKHPEHPHMILDTFDNDKLYIPGKESITPPNSCPNEGCNLCFPNEAALKDHVKHQYSATILTADYVMSIINLSLKSQPVVSLSRLKKETPLENGKSQHENVKATGKRSSLRLARREKEKAMGQNLSKGSHKSTTPSNIDFQDEKKIKVEKNPFATDTMAKKIGNAPNRFKEESERKGQFLRPNKDCDRSFSYENPSSKHMENQCDAYEMSIAADLPTIIPLRLKSIPLNNSKARNLSPVVNLYRHKSLVNNWKVPSRLEIDGVADQNQSEKVGNSTAKFVELPERAWIKVEEGGPIAIREEAQECNAQSNIDENKNSKKVNHVCPNKGCRRSYFYKKALLKHVKYKCGKDPRFKCGYCDYKNGKASNVRNHCNRKHHGLVFKILDTYHKNQPYKPVKGDNFFSYPCLNNGCKQIFRSHSDLKRHLARQCKPYYRCAYCPFSAVSPAVVEAHVKKIHSGNDVLVFDTRHQQDRQNTTQ